MRAMPVPFCYPHTWAISMMAALLVFLCACVFVLFPLARCHRQQGSSRSRPRPHFLFGATLRYTYGQGRVALARATTAATTTRTSASHLPAGVPLASHREKVYFKHSHKYWDMVYARFGPVSCGTCSVFGAFATAIGPFTKFTCSAYALRVSVRRDCVCVCLFWPP